MFKHLMVFLLLIGAITACHRANPASTPEVLADTFFFGHGYIDTNQNSELDPDDPPLADASFNVMTQVTTNNNERVGFGASTSTDGAATIVVPGGLTEESWPITVRMEPPAGSLYERLGPADVTLTYPQTTADFLFTQSAPTPLVVWLKWDLFWRVSGGAPEFVLYDDGRLIVRDPTAQPDDLHQYLSVSLSETEMENLWDDLAIDESFFQLDNRYDDLEVTDLPEHTIMVRQQGRSKRVTVSGDLEGNDSGLRPTSPESFLQLFDKLASYHPPQHSEPWQPERVEVIARQVSTPAQRPSLWPDDWPDFSHPDTIQWDETTYSLFLNWETFEALSQPDGGAKTYLINDQPWSLSYEYLFPGAEMW